MSLSITLACLWVLMACVSVALPERARDSVAILLFAVAMGLLGFVLWQHGVRVTSLCGLAVLSLYRKPIVSGLIRAGYALRPLS
jgi:hypothetical protein